MEDSFETKKGVQSNDSSNSGIAGTLQAFSFLTFLRSKYISQHFFLEYVPVTFLSQITVNITHAK